MVDALWHGADAASDALFLGSWAGGRTAGCAVEASPGGSWA